MKRSTPYFFPLALGTGERARVRGSIHHAQYPIGFALNQHPLTLTLSPVPGARGLKGNGARDKKEMANGRSTSSRYSSAPSTRNDFPLAAFWRIGINF